MVKNIQATCTEICGYIKEEVKEGDKIELSLGRCYIPGRIITNNDGVLQIEVDSESIKGLSCIDVVDLKEFLVELKHEHPDGTRVLEALDD